MHHSWRVGMSGMKVVELQQGFVWKGQEHEHLGSGCEGLHDMEKRAGHEGRHELRVET